LSGAFKHISVLQLFQQYQAEYCHVALASGAVLLNL
jgi:hypothetical protein